MQPWRKRMWCIPSAQDSAFVYHLEDVLAVYTRPYDPHAPQICLDETTKQLVADARPSRPMLPGQPARFDYEYVRKGVRNLFLCVEPLRGQRYVWVTERRTRNDWAQVIRDLVDVHYPEAERIVLVMDNLNTHVPAALYETFPPAEARRLLDRLELHYTPKHASWLNMAEIELSVLQQQCLARRIPDADSLSREVAVWVDERNRRSTGIDWRFTATDARIKLKQLYPMLLY